MRALLSALTLLLASSACTQEEEPVTNRFERQKAEIENKANALESQVENDVSAAEARLQNEIDLLQNQPAPAEVNETANASDAR